MRSPFEIAVRKALAEYIRNNADDVLAELEETSQKVEIETRSQEHGIEILQLIAGELEGEQF